MEFTAIRLGLAALALLTLAAPASAQWTRVTQVPVTQLFSMFSNGDSIAAGADTAVYVSVDAGATWNRSSKPAAGVTSIQALRIRNGRLYAGTLGQGVHVSDDLGATWHPFNEGLVGGLFNTQLDVVDFQARGDSLFAATSGAGVYVRGFSAAAWQHFGEVFEPNQASNMNGLALGGTRLLACAGGNGMVFRRDPGDADWTISYLDNLGIHAGLQSTSAEWTGTGWVVGSTLGIFSSVAGQEPWTRFNPGLGPISWTAFATQAGHLFAAIDTPPQVVMETSNDDGATWQVEVAFPGKFVRALAINGANLYAARADGLWRRASGVSSVANGGAPSRLHFAAAGPEPFRDRTRVRFELPVAETASIRIFDVLGRAAGDRIEGWWSPGAHEVTLDAHRLRPGVYAAVLSAGGVREVVRLVHVP